MDGLSVFDPGEIRRAIVEQDMEDIGDRTSPEEIYRLQLEYARQRADKGYCARDLWDIHGWFLRLMPEMLAEFKAARHGSPGRLGENYTNAEGFVANDKCHGEWDAILDRMAFLFREALEDTCSRTNPYADGHAVAFEAFTEKYGMLGEKLNPEPDPAAPGVTAHFMHEVPEFREIDDRYREAERELEAYRADCLKQGMALFAEWLPDLVD